MKRNKLLCGIMIIVTLLCSSVTSFAASSSVALTTEVSEIELYSGDEVELTLKLDNYKDIEKGLNAYKAKIEYDEDVFETLTESSFTPLNNWEGLAFNKDTNEFISIKKIGSTSSESIVKIKFKVKDDVKGQDTKIYIKDFVTSEGKYDIYAENVVESTEIHIIEKSNQLPDEDIDKDEDPVVPDDSDNKDDSDDNTNTVIDNTVIDNTNTTVDNTTIDNNTNTTIDNTTNNSTNSTTNKNTNQTNNQTTNKNTSTTTNATTNTTSGGSKTSTNVTKNGNTQNSSDTTSTKKLPSTGLSIFNRVVLIAIIILIGIAVLIRRKEIKLNLIEKNKKSDKKEKAKKLFGLFLIVGIVSATELTGIVKAMGTKGELNSDGSIDYSDVNLLERYLISLVDIDDDKLENADINSDKYITVTDLTLLVQKIEKKLDYTVDVHKIGISNYYPEKGEDLELKIFADVSYGAEIEKIVINGNEYSVTKENGVNIYDVIVKSPENAGVYELDFTEVTLNNEQKIKIDNSEKVCVLKQMPTIEEYILDDSESGKAKISFNLIDSDDSATSSEIVVSKKVSDDGTLENIITKEISKGENKIEIDVQDGQNYQIDMTVNYNLAVEQIVEHDEDKTGFITNKKEFQANISNDDNNNNDSDDNNSEDNNDNKENEEETKVEASIDEATISKNCVEKNETINITYKINVTPQKEISRICVNDIEYSAIKQEDGTYKITLNAPENAGTHKFSTTKIILEDGETVDVSNELTVDILKDIPKINVTKQEDDLSNDVLKINYTITDPDEAYESAKVKLIKVINEKEEELKEFNIIKDIDGNGIVSFNSLEEDTDYIVRFVVTYNRHVEDKLETVNFDEKIHLNRDYKFEISNIETLKENEVSTSFEKNESIKISFESSNASSKEPTTIKVNGKEYTVTKEGDKYVAIVDGFENVGEKTIEIEKIILSNGKEFLLDENNTIKITVVDSTSNDDKENEDNKDSDDNNNNDNDEKNDEEETKIEASIEEATISKNCVEKDEEVTITYKISTTSQKEISRICVNGIEYSTVKQEDDTYQITLNSPKIAGNYKLNTTEIVFENGEAVNVSNELTVDVLKDIPKFEEINQEDDLLNDVVKVNYTFTDPDETYKSAKVKLIKVIDGKEEELNEINLIKEDLEEKGTLDFSGLEEDTDYIVRFVITYNRHVEDQIEITNFDEKIHLNRDYKFEISNIETLKENEVSTSFEKNESIKISFTSSNASSKEPITIKVNGKEYTVTKEGDKYVAIVDGFENVGENTIEIESIILSNGKEFVLNENNIIKINITDITSNDNQDNDNQDNDNQDNDNQDNDNQDNDDQDNNDQDNDNQDNNNQDNNQEDNNNDNDGNEENKDSEDNENNSDNDQNEEETKVEASIEDATISKNCIEKGEEVTITYKINVTPQKEITRIRVNNVEYDAVKQEDGTYKISLNAPETAGTYTFNTTKIIIENDEGIDVSNELTVDVLKDIPELEETKQEDDLVNDAVKIIYTIIDPDEAYESAKVKLIKVVDGKEEELNEFDIIKDIDGKGVLSFSNLEEDTDYILRFVITYNRHAESQSEIVKYDEKINLIHDYKLQVSDIKTSNAENETQYFVKNENIVLSFTSTNESSFIPEMAVINGVGYSLTRDSDTNTYKVELPGFKDSGVQELKIEKIILSNKKYLDLTKDNTIKVEVLKEEPTVKEFAYQISDTDIEVKFNVVDDANVITNVKVVVTDGNNKEIKNEKISSGENKFTFDRTTSEVYNVKVMADYDLDTNEIGTGQNEYTDKTLLDEQIDISIRKLELKDITDVSVYKIEDDTVTEITTLKDSDLEQLTSYVAKVEMKDMPSFYATIDGYVLTNQTENEKTGTKTADVELKLNCSDNVVIYDGDEAKSEITVPFVTITGRRYFEGTKQTFESILEEMNNNPSGNITLTCDIDASGFKASQTDVWKPALVNSYYSGTFDGNGYTIYNLSSTLFSSLEGATIKNLVIEDAVVETKQNSNGVNIINRGLIANEAENTTFSNVHIKNSRVTSMYAIEGYGMLAGKLTSGNISNCSASNCVIKGDGVYVGGLIGWLNGGNITNSYVTGSIEYTETYSPSTPYIGGIAGYTDGTVNISNTIAKIETASTKGPDENGGLIGTSKGTATLTNNLSLSTGSQAYRLTGSAVSSRSSNNYELKESTLLTNTSLNYVKEIGKDEITSEFFENTLKLNSNIWDFENTSYDNLPTLKNLDPNNSNKEYGSDSGFYIPDYDRLSKLNDYNENKKIAYSNMYKLMPFYDARYLVADGNKIADNDILNTKFIKSILAYDSNHNLIVALTEENYKNIDFIKVVFTDDTTKDYTVTFKDFYSNVVSYKINELDIEYNYDKFIVNQNYEIVTELVEYIQNIDYSNDLSGLLKISYGGRIYRDYFNNTIKANAKEFVLKYLENSNIGNIVTDSELITNILKTKLITNGELKQTLFAYNYYSRWYDIDVNGANISDIMLFKGNLYSNSMGIDKLTIELMNSKWVNSPHTKYFYRDNIGPRTRISTIGEFIDYNVNTIGTYESVDDWFTDTFKGILYEAPAKDHPEIEYRAWTQLKKKEDYILALLTIPENSGYMVSYPTQFLVGSVSVYGFDVTTEDGKASLLAKMKAFGDNFATMYNTTAGFLDKKYLNDNCDIEIDRTGGSVELNEKTTDPFIINFNEAMYEWREINMGGQGAYGQDGKVVWVVYAALNDFNDATHESGHNQAVKIFLENNGRRGGTTTTIDEDYPDGNIRQSFSDGSANFNLTYNFTTDSSVTTNLTPERINTREKIESYYKEMFETIDFLDYAEAKAFLQLTPEEQSKVAVQVYYPRTEVEGYDEANAKASDFAIVGWRTLTEEQFESMNLKTIEDIYKNQITIKPGVTDNSTLSGEAGSYGSEGIYVRHWYQAHNDYGRTYSYGLKATAWEMLGVGGYEGYVTYYSGKSANDLDAIRKVTGDDTMTWEKYKLGRYSLMESKWNSSAYINADELVEQYVNALKTDAQNGDRNVTASTNIRRINYNYLKRVTNDFRSEALGSDTNIVHITSAEDFISNVKANPMGYFVLDNDIDLSTITEGDAIVTETFSGIFNGNNHKITGNKITIFNTVKYANISNLYVVGNEASVFNTVSYANISNLQIENSTASVFNTVSYTNISNVEIENSSISSTLQDVGALVRNLSYAKIENITGNNITVTSTNKEVGGLFGIVANVEMSNIYINDATVSGNSRVGGIAGYVGKITLENGSSNNVKVSSTGNATGGFIGEVINSSVIKNCFATGTVSGNQDIGGFVGYLNTSTISNCYTFVTITGNAGTAGFVGQSIGNSTVTNNIALGNSKNVYKFDGRTGSEQFTGYSNNYEYEESKGNSTLTRSGIDFTDKISVVSKATYIAQEFFTTTLGWDENIWDLSEVVNEKLPKLKSSPYYDDEDIIKTYTISNADEFIQKLTEIPDGIFYITDDIDFSGKEYSLGSSVIETAFSGKIEGNNHTISNLINASLFNEFSGQISNLNITGFEHSVERTDYSGRTIINTRDGASYNNTDNVSAFAKVTNGAKLTNIKFDKVIIFARHYIGIVSAKDTNSTFERISVTDSFVYGRSYDNGGGTDISTFIGKATGSKITNCYVQGELRYYQANKCGALIGEATNVTVDKVITDVTVPTYGGDIASGFIGAFSSDTTSQVTNSAVLGKVNSGRKEGQRKFVATGNGTDETNINQVILGIFDNCYENGNFAENSNSNDTTNEKIKVVYETDLLDKNFYTTTLGLDENIWDLSDLKKVVYTRYSMGFVDTIDSINIGLK